MSEEYTLSIYGSHDASAVFIDKNSKLRVLEYERFVKKRYAMFSTSFDSRVGLGSNTTERNAFIEYIKTHIKNEPNCIIYNELNNIDLDFLKSKFRNAKFKKAGHHESHAAVGFHLSPFKSAVIFSIDGGGDDYGEIYATKIFQGNSDGINCIAKVTRNLGRAYGRIASSISEIKNGSDSKLDSLVYAGKIMGLAAYGNIKDEWILPFRKYYTHLNLHTLSKGIGIDLAFNKQSGQTAYDIAATSQYVFEEQVMGLISQYDSYENIILTGGCALNVLFNQRMYDYCVEHDKNLYVPPCPNDCGIGTGQFLLNHPSASTLFNVYNGFPILDSIDDVNMDGIESIDGGVVDIVSLISDGNIIGIVDGDSEIGPRALGNRSIICDPSIADMKDVLNSKVKFREWFRPFAPVCRVEDKDTFFKNAGASSYMTYAPTIKDEYTEKLQSIAHTDNTARLQTVTREEHALFYDILTELYSIGKVPVILNTSFNIKGSPILTTLADAIEVLRTTKLDYVYNNGLLFKLKDKV